MRAANALRAQGRFIGDMILIWQDVYRMYTCTRRVFERVWIRARWSGGKCPSAGQICGMVMAPNRPVSFRLGGRFKEFGSFLGVDLNAKAR